MSILTSAQHLETWYLRSARRPKTSSCILEACVSDLMVVLWSLNYQQWLKCRYLFSQCVNFRFSILLLLVTSLTSMNTVNWLNYNSFEPIIYHLTKLHIVGQGCCISEQFLCLRWHTLTLYSFLLTQLDWIIDKPVDKQWRAHIITDRSLTKC